MDERATLGLLETSEGGLNGAEPPCGPLPDAELIEEFRECPEAADIGDKGGLDPVDRGEYGGTEDGVAGDCSARPEFLVRCGPSSFIPG